MSESEPTPRQTVAKTVAEVAPKLAVAAKAIAIDDHRRLLRDNAARVADSHRAMAKAIGMEDTVAPAAREDEVGHLIVTGDINVADPASLQQAIGTLSGKAAANSDQAATAGQQESTPLWQKALVSAAMVASGAGVGAGIPWLLGAFDRPAAESPTFADTNTRYELSITPDVPQ